VTPFENRANEPNTALRKRPNEPGGPSKAVERTQRPFEKSSERSQRKSMEIKWVAPVGDWVVGGAWRPGVRLPGGIRRTAPNRGPASLFEKATERTVMPHGGTQPHENGCARAWCNVPGPIFRGTQHGPSKPSERTQRDPSKATERTQRPFESGRTNKGGRRGASPPPESSAAVGTATDLVHP
jgi:hypothetical protein